jgi:hypothetical protein
MTSHTKALNLLNLPLLPLLLLKLSRRVLAQPRVVVSDLGKGVGATGDLAKGGEEDGLLVGHDGGDDPGT